MQRTLFHLIKGIEDLGGRTLSKVFPGLLLRYLVNRLSL